LNPSLTVEQVVNSIEWSRGAVILVAHPGGGGRELKKKHYWVVVSRNDINRNTELPIIAVPMVSHRETTYRDAVDLEVPKGKSPTGSAIIVQCRLIKALDCRARRVTATGKRCDSELMKKIDEQLIEVLGMDESWLRKS
jgi:mRNA-degrading endonuclease toxin of MazEF toxin-antitoxin module